MDYSGSIKKELENSKKLVRSLVTSLRKKTSSSREAIVVFDQFAGVKATFGQYNFTETLRLVKNRKREGRTRIDKALKIAQCGVFNSTRHEARKITVTVSDSGPDGRKLPALGTNQIAGFAEYRPLTH